MGYWEIIAAYITALVVGVVLYKVFIPVLRRVKLGQKILEIGPSWHKCKEGTPTLGGLFFIAACFFSTAAVLLAFGFIKPKSGLFSLFLLLAYSIVIALIGFIDDYIKLFKKRNKGLTAPQKMLLLMAATALYLFCRAYFLQAKTSLTFPWGASIDLGIWYYVIMLLAIVYIINCANLTDGIDGLAGSIGLLMCILFIAMQVYENSPSVIASSALAGGLTAFLIFNFHPAKIFMGDTGSLFLGAFAVGMTLNAGCELLLLLIGFVWICEGLSVMIQVASYKLTGKRIFKMSPIHHHFEMCGWSEVKIVTVFSLITAIACGAGYWLWTLSLRF